jgi:hypothetical protein
MLILVLLNPGHCLAKNKYRAVPEESRARFVHRIQLYLRFTLARETEKLYSLYDEETLCNLCRGKQECIDDCAPPMTLEMDDIETIQLLSLRALEIRPAKYRSGKLEIVLEQEELIKRRGHKGRTIKSKVNSFATFERGDWYFSLISINGTVLL